MLQPGGLCPAEFSDPAGGRVLQQEAPMGACPGSHGPYRQRKGRRWQLQGAEVICPWPLRKTAPEQEQKSFRAPSGSPQLVGRYPAAHSNPEPVSEAAEASLALVTS